MLFRSKLMKARSLIKGDAYDLGREYLKNYQLFDYMLAESNDFLHNKEGHTVITEEMIDLPHHMFIRSFLPRVQRKMISYWGVDDLGCFFVLRSLFSDSNTKVEEPINEATVFVPYTSKGKEKCILYFFSDFNYSETTKK